MVLTPLSTLSPWVVSLYNPRDILAFKYSSIPPYLLINERSRIKVAGSVTRESN